MLGSSIKAYFLTAKKATECEFLLLAAIEISSFIGIFFMEDRQKMESAAKLRRLSAHHQVLRAVRMSVPFFGASKIARAYQAVRRCFQR